MICRAKLKDIQLKSLIFIKINYLVYYKNILLYQMKLKKQI